MERGGPITEATTPKIVARAGEEARIGLPVHPHVLRHATGFYLANTGVDTQTIQAYLGRRSIMHTRWLKVDGERQERRSQNGRTGHSFPGVRKWQLHFRRP